MRRRGTGAKKPSRDPPSKIAPRHRKFATFSGNSSVESQRAAERPAKRKGQPYGGDLYKNSSRTHKNTTTPRPNHSYQFSNRQNTEAILFGREKIKTEKTRGNPPTSVSKNQKNTEPTYVGEGSKSFEFLKRGEKYKGPEKKLAVCVCDAAVGRLHWE